MQEKVLLVFSFLTFCQVAAVFEWPFYNEKTYGGGTQVKATIGSKDFPVSLNLTLYNFCPGLTVYSNVADKKSGFDPSKSDTFKKLGDYTHGNTQIGQRGQDDLIVESPSGTKQSLKKMPFNVIDKETCVQKSLSLAHTVNVGANNEVTNEFIDAMFVDKKDKTLTFLFDTIPDDTVYAQSSGKLVFGDNPDVCKNWRSVQDDPSDTYTWTFKFDKITVGGDLLVNKPKQVGIIAFDSAIFRFPTEIYNSLSKMMDLEKDDHVSCDIKKNITYHINGFKIDIMPADYLIAKHIRYKNRCIFMGYDGGNNVDYTFPVQIFDRYCARFDYGKKEIGFADRTDFTGKKGSSSTKSIFSIWTVFLINYVVFM